MKRLTNFQKKLLLTIGLGIGIAGIGFTQSVDFGAEADEINRRDLERRSQLIAEQQKQQQMSLLREAAELKKLLAELGIVCDVGLVQDAQGNYKLVSLNNNGNNNGQPITIIVPDNVQLIIKKESEAQR
jgi:hypothetical protein